MDFESPDVERDFPGLYSSDSARRNISRDSDYSDEEKLSRKDLLGKRKEKRESKKDKGYVAFEGESSENEVEETKSPGKLKKNRSTFTFPRKDKKEKKDKSKDTKEKKEEEKESKLSKKDLKGSKKESKKSKEKSKDEKKKKEIKLLKKDKKKKSGDQFSDERPLFGIPLKEAVERSKGHDNIEIPVFVRECIDYIEEHGLACEGIYKISGVKSKVRQLKCMYNQGEKVYLYEHEPHVVASLLKQFLRDLPDPVLTTELVPKFEEAATLKSEQKRVETLLKLLDSLPHCNRLLLSWIMVHMIHVAKLEKRNKMNQQNISIALSPVLQISQRVLQAFFTYSEVLFKGIQIKKYVPPTETESNRLSLELPDSPKAIEDELFKQENLLNMLHEELNSGVRNTEKEEQLWEVQRIVTQLKRKLRFLRQVVDASNQSNVNNVQENKTEECLSLPNPAIESADVKDDSISVTKNSDETDHHIPPHQEDDSTFQASNVPDVDNKSVPVEEKLPEENTKTLENENSSEEIKEEIQEQASSISTAPPASLEKSKTTQKVESQPCQVKVSNSDETLALRRELIKLVTEQEELVQLGDELRRKINSEKSEVERLRQEISEYQRLYKYRIFSKDSTDNSSSESEGSSPSDDEENGDLVETLKDLFRKNEHLENLNKELSQKIQKEREACVELKVQIKMAQKAT